MEKEGENLLGAAAGTYAAFPWLIKFLDARDWLSVQVHPDDAAAQRLWPGEGGKTEAWLVLDAKPGSRIYAGLKPGVNEERFRAALHAGSVTDCLHDFEPRAGDCVFLTAGTVHAVGGGVLMAEVQQTSDATFRLFDWNRRDASGRVRPLHIEEGLACTDWTRGPVKPIPVEGFGQKDGVRRHQSLVRCPFFALDYMAESEPFVWGGAGRLQAAVVLHGRGRLATAWGEETVATGQCWLLPAAMPPATCRPEQSLALLLSTLG
jgi:mannose-6-phosphate isomerase